ncbi:ABC transporter permease [Salinispora arenicola]|uniref:Peptide ABC transporter permease n=1 Tax=Salinispora arenicola TaxID=168697 RepID=A0A542XJV7_SALAC|nr:ABC transporter permease [Salinispora arenicola]MCN0154734.1 ABC transporter permease [Salinispora arenicola]MCN0180648.1 ABC transporter permease [Salinispora arenicola]NIL43112.1 ABC transporter permease [Salinispora arenicola]NIL55988.1 ABC transporter permease [Salinispora arenicola]NIL60867.1 ABC transporter permease [Salinispora arenicola]
MFRFIVRRLLQLIPTLFGLSLLLFIWLRRLPGGPETAILGERGTPEMRAAIRRSMGLDEPILVQYGRFVRRLARLDLGTSSSTKRPVIEEFLERFPGTVELTITALVIAIGVGIPLGYLAARRRGRLLDHFSVGGSLIGICIPIFFLAYVLKAIFSENLGWFPSSGRQDPTLDATRITNFFVLDGLMTREWDAAADALWHLVLPGLALATIPLAIIVRITRASVLEVLNEDFVRTAEAKGLTERTVRGRHVLRNSLLPVVTSIGLLTGGLLSGAVLTETVFAFTGIGAFIYEAINHRDYPVLMGFIMIISVVYVLVNLLVDLSYSLIDPRVRVR